VTIGHAESIENLRILLPTPTISRVHSRMVEPKETKGQGTLRLLLNDILLKVKYRRTDFYLW